MPHTAVSARTRAWVPSVALALTAGLGLAACGGGGHGSQGPSSDSPSPGKGAKDAVQFVLGAGAGGAGSAGNRTKVPGVLQAMAVDAHGTVGLITADAKGFVLWTTDATGDAKSQSHPITGLPTNSLYGPTGIGHVAGQAAAAPDGSYYLALNSLGLWHIGADGKAQRVIAAGASGNTGADGPASSFTTGEVLGVAVGSDGTVYFSDYASVTGAGFVHKLSGGTVTTVAGKAVRTRAEASAKNSGPAALDVANGAPAKNVVLAYHPNAGALDVNGQSLFLDTGDTVITISDAGLATPVVINDPSGLEQPSLPYNHYGRALNALLSTPWHGDPNHTSGIAYESVSQALFFSSGAPVPALKGKDLHSGLGPGFDWKGDFTAAQAQYIKDSRSNQFVAYDTEDGRLAGVLTDSDTIDVYDSHLYAANDTCAANTACDPAKTTAAVVRRAVPVM